MSGWILAVDFGTVNTGAAIRFADGRVEKVKLDPNSDTMPSAVVVTEGRWRVGQAALNARRTHPDTFIGSPKARLGQEPLVLGEDLVSPAQIASHVLAAVRERAVRAAGGTDPDRLVLTHPVRWGRARLTALQEAAQIAGFSPEAIRLLPEPIAALHAHVQPGSLPPGSRVAVVDTGGGTCDVAVLQTTDDPAPGKDLLVVAQEGDDRLGGNDLDDLLYQWVLAQLTTAGRTDMVTALADPEHLGAALTLLDVVRSAKQDLSEHTNAPVAVAVAGQETTLTVTREEYEDLIAEPMTRAGALTTRALTASGTTHLAGLYLTGGTAYTPALAQTLHKVTGILTAPLGDPKLAVAVGALKTPVAVMTPTQLAALAHQLTQRRQQPTPPAPQPTPIPQPPTPARQVASGPPRITPPPSEAPTAGYAPTWGAPAPGPLPEMQDEPSARTSRPNAPGYPSGPQPAPSTYTSTAPGYAPTPGPAPSYAQGPTYPPPAPRPAPAPVPPRPATAGSGLGGKIAVGVLAGVLVLGAIGFGTWWFALRDTNATPTPTPTPTPTCWDGTTTDPCPTFEKTAAAIYVFGPVDNSNDSRCTPNTVGYVPSGSTYATTCYIPSEQNSVSITQWPSVDAATSAFKNFPYTNKGRWTTRNSSDEMGTQWELDTPSGTRFVVNCYDGIPFCIEFSGTTDADINAMKSQFHALSTQGVQNLADYLSSH